MLDVDLPCQLGGLSAIQPAQREQSNARVPNPWGGKRECPANGGLRRVGGTLVLVGVWLKKLADPRAECSIEDCTANLEQEIGPSA